MDKSVRNKQVIYFIYGVLFTIMMSAKIDGIKYSISTPVLAESSIDAEREELRKLKVKINNQIEKIQKIQYRKLRYLREFSEIEFAIALKRKNAVWRYNTAFLTFCDSIAEYCTSQSPRIYRNCISG